MNILADENIAPIIVERLRQAGHIVRFIAEIAKGIDDIEVLDIANKQGEIVLTDNLLGTFTVIKLNKKRDIRLLHESFLAYKV